MAEKRNLETGDDCSIQRTLAVIGDRWTLLILRDVFRGVHRFGSHEEAERWQIHQMAHIHARRSLTTT